jgi:hypothetical protein
MNKQILWCTHLKHSLTDKDVKKMVKIVEKHIKESELEFEVGTKDEYNIDFIWKESTCMDEKFRLYSEYGINNMTLTAMRVANSDTLPHVISQTGTLKSTSMVVRDEQYFKMLKEMFMEITKEMGCKLIVHFI